LQIDHDLAAVFKHQRHHATHALGVDVGVGVLVEAVAAGLHASQHGLGVVQILQIGHYNSSMSALFRSILVSALTMAGAFALSACGQKGDLYLPAGMTATPAPAPAASSTASPAPAVRP
jgi:predicted small lipoprotein YifL